MELIIESMKRGNYARLSNPQLAKLWEKVLKKEFPDLCVLRGAGEYGVDIYFYRGSSKSTLLTLCSVLRHERRWRQSGRASIPAKPS